MKKFCIYYIDGPDLKHKIYNTFATDRSMAARNLQTLYPDGDFDHRIIEVSEEQINKDIR